MTYRVAIMDDYQNVALKFADWTPCQSDATIVVFNEHFGDEGALIAALADFDIVCLMRERTSFPRSVMEALPKLRLIVTSGMRNSAIDIAAARERGVLVCGTESSAHPPTELVFAHLLEFNRRAGHENARLKAGAYWQTTIGRDLHGKTLGLLGLGRLGRRVAEIANAFGMFVIAWSQNLTPETCESTGARYVDKETLFRTSDVVSVHLRLSERTRGLVGANELALMKPDALLINTARSAIVDEGALVDALRSERIGGAALDVFEEEPLAGDHPLRSLERAQITPHLGYVSEANYRVFYGQTVENIRAFLDGKPKRVIEA